MRKGIELGTENQLEEKVNNAENKRADIEHRTEEIYDYQIDPEYVEQKLIDLEDGILKTPGETWETVK